MAHATATVERRSATKNERRTCRTSPLLGPLGSTVLMGRSYLSAALSSPALHLVPRRERRRRRLLRVLVLAGVLLGLGYHYVYVPRAPLPPLTGALSRETLRVGERPRTFAYYAPASLPPSPPLLIAFHGSGQTGESFRAGTGY